MRNWVRAGHADKETGPTWGHSLWRRRWAVGRRWRKERRDLGVANGTGIYRDNVWGLHYEWVPHPSQKEIIIKNNNNNYYYYYFLKVKFGSC